MVDVEEFVESAGLYFERLGLSRTSGRVMGCLLADTGESADAPGLCERLGVAKSSMSVALKQLEQGGLVERYRPPRARRDHYRLTEDVFGRAFRAKMAEFAAFVALAEQGLGVVGDHPAARVRLEHMRDMYAFMAREFPALLDRWDAEKAGAAHRRDGSGRDGSGGDGWGGGGTDGSGGTGGPDGSGAVDPRRARRPGAPGAPGVPGPDAPER